MSKLEYLAIPYSNIDKNIMDFRAAVSDYIFAELSSEGRIVYAPISSCHNISKKYGLPKTFEFWEKVCLEFVSSAYKLIVVKLPGWQSSVGLTAELKLAQILGLKIEYLDPISYIMNDKELMDWYLSLEENHNVKYAQSKC
jgi:hypothetical protein